MKRKIFSFVLIISMLFGIQSIPAFAADTPPKIPVVALPADGSAYILMRLNSGTMTVNGVKQEVDPGRDTAPITINDRTMVPARALTEAMGGTAGWNESTFEITLKANGNTVVMTLDKTSYTVNGAKKTMDAAPVVVNGRTLIPLRSAGEALGCKVDWYPDTSEILVTFKAATSKPSPPPAPAATPGFVGDWYRLDKDERFLELYKFQPDNSFGYIRIDRGVEFDGVATIKGTYSVSGQKIKFSDLIISLALNDGTVLEDQKADDSSSSFLLSGGKLTLDENPYAPFTDKSLTGTSFDAQKAQQGTVPAPTPQAPVNSVGNASIVGTWRYVSTNFINFLYGPAPLPQKIISIYRFRTDGSYTYSIEVQGGNMPGKSEQNGRYKVSGGTVYLTGITETYTSNSKGAATYQNKPVGDETLQIRVAEGENGIELEIKDKIDANVFKPYQE